MRSWSSATPRSCRRSTAGDAATAHSHDHGRTWRSTALTGIFDALSGPDWYGAGRDIGHYIALAATRNGFDAAFAQAKPAATHGDTDLFYAQIALG